MRAFQPEEDATPCHDFNLNGLCDETEDTGCTYPLAPNYSATDAMDDGSCELICQADLNGDGVIQINDLLDFLVMYGSTCEP